MPSELAEEAEIILFMVTLEEMSLATDHIKWCRGVKLEDVDVEKAILGFLEGRKVLAVKIQRRQMESAYRAGKTALRKAKNCENFAMVSMVAAPFAVGTITILAPEPKNDVLIVDLFDVGSKKVIKSSNGMPNRMLINLSYKLEGEKTKHQIASVP